MARSGKSFGYGLALTVLFGASASLATPAQAQYFGHNKVQYENFNFKVLHTAHFDLYYYPEEQAAAGIAARMAERWYARLSAVMHHPLSGRQPLILYATQAQFQAFYGRTLEEALAWCLVWLMAPEFETSPFLA